MTAAQPQLWVVAGPNGAGKSTLVSHRVARRIPVVNPDDIAVELPAVGGRPDERRAGAPALKRRSELLEAGASFAIETTLSGSSTLRFMAAARAARHKVTLVYVGLVSSDLSALRVASRVRRGGHKVPVSAVYRRYPDTLARLPRAIALADRTLILDNSGARRRLLLSVEHGRVRFLARDLPVWFAGALPDMV